MKNVVHEKIQALMAEYSAQLPDKIAQLESEWLALNRSKDESILQTLTRDAHSLSGTAGTYGYIFISDLSRKLEVKLREFNLQHIDKVTINEINDLLQDLKQLAFKPPEKSVSKKINFAVPVTSDIRQIFILENNQSLIKSAVEQLQQFNYSIKVFEDIETFLNALKTQMPDLVILDIDLANDISAAEIAALREESVIIIYSHTVDDLMARLFTVRHHGQSFLLKPFDPNLLLRSVDNLFTARKLHDEHILIVDDSPFLADYFATILEHAGLITKTVTDPKNFLNVLQEFQPDLILMDINMPFCSGLELAQIVQQQETLNSVPIIFLSSITERAKQLEVLSLAGDDFLTKPIDPKNLLASIRNRLMRSRILRSRMMRDSLTNLYNHTMIHHQLEREMLLADRYQKDLSLVLFDIDHFKKVNDTFGHQAGDKILKDLGDFLHKCFRKTDIIGRYGGEEFLVILPNTKAADAVSLVNNVRDQFAKTPHTIENKKIYVTISGDISNYPSIKSPIKLVKAADEALYLAKEKGRNRIVVAE